MNLIYDISLMMPLIGKCTLIIWTTKKENMNVFKSMLSVSKALENILQMLLEYHRVSDLTVFTLNQ